MAMLGGGLGGGGGDRGTGNERLRPEEVQYCN